MGNIAKKCECTQCVCESRVSKNELLDLDTLDSVERMLTQTKSLVDMIRTARPPRCRPSEQIDHLLWLVSDRLGEIMSQIEN